MANSLAEKMLQTKTRHFFKNRFITQKVYTAITRTRNKIIPLTSLSKYLNYETRKWE